jgi:hypothetical protein
MVAYFFLQTLECIFSRVTTECTTCHNIKKFIFSHNLFCVLHDFSKQVKLLLQTILTLIPLKWTKWWASASASKWRMGFNSAFKGLTLILLTSTKWWAPASASKWRMGFNSAFKGLTLILLKSTKWWAPVSARKWRMVFNSSFKGLNVQCLKIYIILVIEKKSSIIFLQTLEYIFSRVTTEYMTYENYTFLIIYSVFYAIFQNK